MGQRVEDAEELNALSLSYGSTRALGHQAHLWKVKPGKTKSQTTDRILLAIQASQNPGGQEAEDDDNDEQEEDVNSSFV